MTLCASLFFFFIDTATTEIYTLSLHDALPISSQLAAGIFRVGPAAHGVAPDRESAGRARRVAARRGQPARLGLHGRSEEHTSELQSLRHLVCRLLLEKKNH